jgi:pyruvate dehydrogenase E1 component alpha subunit
MQLSRESARWLFERMILIRRFEERVGELFADGKLPGVVHLYIGEEAVAVGACSVLRTDDYVISSHRGHGHMLAKGGDINRLMAELYGKQTGCCKGKGGSLHIADVAVGMLGGNGIVGAGVPIAVGAAYGAAKIRRTDQVAVAFIGDGATNTGAFHEACNMASAWKLPVVLVCENNLYGVGTRIGRVAPTENLSALPAAHGIATQVVDGNAVLEVRAAVEAAVVRARAGQGPGYVECKTWRQRAHVEGERPEYWNETERRGWLARDPIQSFREQLIHDAVAVEAELDDLDTAARKLVATAVAFAESSPFPDETEALEDVFA